MAGDRQTNATNDNFAIARIPPVALVIGLAGLVPFLCGVLILWMPGVLSGSGDRLILSYSAIILAFLGGIRWGTAIGPYDGQRQAFEFAASVLGSLVGLTALFLPPIPALTLLIAAYLVQALWDVMSVESGRLPAWFGKLRMLLTAGAVLSLILALVAKVVI